MLAPAATTGDSQSPICPRTPMAGFFRLWSSLLIGAITAPALVYAHCHRPRTSSRRSGLVGARGRSATLHVVRDVSWTEGEAVGPIRI